jgi:hypothetical protein
MPSDIQLSPGRYVRITAVSSGKIAVEEVQESLLGSSSPPNIPAGQPEGRFPSVRDLVKMASGQVILDTCSEHELRVSILLPAMAPEPDSDRS